MPTGTIGSVNEVASISGQSRTSFAGRLKDEYLPKMDDHVHTKVVISGLIANKRGTMGGQRSIASFMDSFPQSAGIAAFEGDTLPTPRVGTYGNPVIWERSLYMRLRWTGHVERAARKGDSVAWAQPRGEDMKAARKQFELNFARMLYLGPYQPLATIKSVSTTTVTLYNRNARTSAANDRWKFGTQYLRKNMSLSTVPTTGGNVDAGSAAASYQNYTNERYITAIDTSTTDPTITIDTAFTDTPTDLHLVVPFGSRRAATTITEGAASDTYFAGPNGLLNLISNSSYKAYVYGLSRTTYPTLAGFVLDNSGVLRAWDEDYIMFAIDRVNDDGTGGEPDTLVCNSSIRREYVRETENDRRFAEVQTNKGYGKLKFTAGDVQLPVVTDRDCPPGLMFALSTDGFGWFEHKELSMVDDGERFVSDKDAHEIVMVKSGNLMTNKPHDNAIIEDINYSTTGLTT